ncbi:hypothetical protein ACFX11_006024 [Malus domestica]
MEFNDALLAKQCWRLLCDPSSLCAKVIKARYFPNCSFLDAKKWGRASWAWSSLLMGRDLLINGTHWQIMGGQDVRVWVDRWLPFIPLERPSPLGEAMVTRNLHVSSLIFPQSRDWDIIFLLPFLSMADQEAIEGTPIGDISRRDRLIWAATKNGRYTVKSGYRWLQSRSLSMRDHRLPLVRFIPEKLWNCIWKVDVPPKIRHFLWNSMHNIVATKANLYKRRSTTSPTCPICLGDDEIVEHLFLVCPWVQAVWCAFVFNQVRINPLNVVLAISNAVRSFLAVSNDSVVSRV